MKNRVRLFLLVAIAMLANVSFAQEGKEAKVENMTPKEVIQYLLDASNLSYDQQAEKYFNVNQKSVDYINKLNWPAIRNFNYGLTVKSSVFQYLILNREKFYHLYGVDSVDDVIRSIYGSAMNGFLSDSFSVEPDTANYKNLREELIALKLPSADRLIVGMDMSFYELSQNWEQYAKTAILHIEGYSYDNHRELNYIAFSFFEKISNKVYLTKALDWAKCSTELSPNPDYVDTYNKLFAKIRDQK